MSNSSLATREVFYQPINLAQHRLDTGVIIPDDLRVKLPLRVSALDAAENVIRNAVEFCLFLPLVKVPDSVYVDEGDVVLYWKTGQKSNVIAVIDDKYFHYFIRPESGADLHKSDIEIDGNSGFMLKPYLPPHPDSQQSRNALSTGNPR